MYLRASVLVSYTCIHEHILLSPCHAIVKKLCLGAQVCACSIVRECVEERPNGSRAKQEERKGKYEFPKFVSMRNCVHMRRMDGHLRWVETRYNFNKLEYDEWNAQTRTLTLVNRVVYQVCLCLCLCVCLSVCKRVKGRKRDRERERVNHFGVEKAREKRRTEKKKKKHPTEPPFLPNFNDVLSIRMVRCWWYAFATFTLQLNALKNI